MTSSGTTLELRLEMRIPPTWKHVDVLRTAVRHCVSALTGEGVESDSIGTVASELVENAIKYGDWSGEEPSRLVVCVAGAPEELEVTVTNPTRPDSDDFEKLQRMLDWIRSFESPREAYMARVQEVMAAEEASGSRMGLVRVVCEGACTLTAERTADRRNVVVRAKARLPELSTDPSSGSMPPS